MNQVPYEPISQSSGSWEGGHLIITDRKALVSSPSDRNKSSRDLYKQQTSFYNKYSTLDDGTREAYGK